MPLLSFTGRIAYGTDGVPTIADRTTVLDQRDVSPDTPAVEAQDSRKLDDGDADPDDELVFSASFHNGGQAMGVDLDSGAVTDHAPTSPYYEEAEGIDPTGAYVLVERDLTAPAGPAAGTATELPSTGPGVPPVAAAPVALLLVLVRCRRRTARTSGATP